MVTIKDIADRLGVSVSTVSKGLNGAKDISETLRQTVLDTAVEMGYTNRKSRKEENRQLCLIIENMDYEQPDQFGYEIILGFKQAAFKEGWDVTVVPTNHDFQKEKNYDSFMLEQHYSGAFILGFSLDDPWMEQFSKTSFPTILLDNFIQANPKVGSIGTDSEEAIDMAIEHLITLGHEKIAFLNGSGNSMVSDARMKAYLASMAKHQLPVNPNLAVYGYYVADAAKYHVSSFLDLGATAILCGNDLIALGVVEACKKEGYQVPEDISVIGFDDLPFSETMNPPLTTIRQDRLELGKSGFYVLHAMSEELAFSKNLLRPVLVVRESTAPAKPRLILRKQRIEKDSVKNINPQLYEQYLKQTY
ncbi:MAG: LacI family transcriptional regulator [Acetatifactor sp.]|nr:LacI family transcriptional regulator [Acetatifactor sp.]